MIDQSNRNQHQDQRGSRGSRRPRVERAPSEFQERVLEINRVTRVVKGGKRMRFRALVVIGDKINRISYGLGKANDVTAAVAKAVNEAKKNVATIYLQEGTLPYKIQHSHKSATVLVKPAKAGTGLIAGGAVRVVLELAGVKDAVAKVLGSANKISNVAATVEGLAQVQSPNQILTQRGKPERKAKAAVN